MSYIGASVLTKQRGALPEAPLPPGVPLLLLLTDFLNFGGGGVILLLLLLLELEVDIIGDAVAVVVDDVIMGSAAAPADPRPPLATAGSEQLLAFSRMDSKHLITQSRVGAW